MEEKYVRWGAWASFGIFVLFILGVLGYILSPIIIGAISGENSCSYTPDYSTGQSTGLTNVRAGISNLCSTTQSFLGLALMIEILFGSFVSLIATGLGVIHLFENKNIPNKALYLVAMVLFGFIGVWYYLKTKPKEVAAS